MLLCYAEGRNATWEAFCVNFDLAVQGTSFDDVRRKLDTAIAIYLEGVAELPAAERKRLLNRRAPLSAWLGPFLHLLKTGFTSRDCKLRYEFTLPAPIVATA
ncbi:MAG TPA: hypothetical protein VLI93_09065 [Acetobacteraceae bacterium]|nr:hypothetical protein [Acetobacteraceae bacterium]